MSYKTTRHITRAEALEILLDEIPNASNKVLEDLMDALADSQQSNRVSMFDNFIVSDFADRN